MSGKRLVILILAALILLTFAAFWGVLGSEFLSFDDDVYVTANRWVNAGLTPAGIKWAFTAFHSANWHPLTWLSHMLDCQVYGLDPLGHHLGNLILHVISTVLLFLLVFRMTGFAWRSAFVAALFAVHPLHVESVAWIAERKDVLSAVFWLLTMHAYVSYAAHGRRAAYVGALIAFALGLMAKPMLVSLPIVLLLVDYWPLGRFGFGSAVDFQAARRLIWEKVPFLILSAASCVVTFAAQSSGGAVVAAEVVPFGVRGANAVVAYTAYVLKMLWPAGLAAMYPHPFDSIPAWQVVASALFLSAVTLLALRAAGSRPYLAVGWFWYILTLLPVIGLVQVGMQSMADRYTYLPLIGLFLAVTWGAAGAAVRLGPAPRTAPILASLAVMVVLACTLGTWRQVGYWKDSETLFKRALAVTERNGLAETNLSIALINRGRYEEAIRHARAAVEIKPRARSYDALGVALVRLGRLDEAAEQYERALRFRPVYPMSLYNLGCVRFAEGRYQDAAGLFRRAASLQPDSADTHYYLARSLAELADADGAIRSYRTAVGLDPRHYLARFNLGVMLNQRGEHQEALSLFEEVVRIKPDYAVAHHNIGSALDSLGRTDEAMRAYREAVRLRPDLGEAHNNLAVDLFEAGRYEEAWKEVRLAERCGVRPHPEFLEALEAKGGGR
ncbi:MAG: tetratricopeptide repeat protein [Armatimonadetes bacterium]|nr:tetratricopeptide repeat protein [Armatimonadota bacterium]